MIGDSGATKQACGEVFNLLAWYGSTKKDSNAPLLCGRKMHHSIVQFFLSGYNPWWWHMQQSVVRCRCDADTNRNVDNPSE